MADAVEDLPVYKQIRRCIAERIERGDYPTGSMIPSENELAEEFGTTRLTIRSAMDELVKSGQIRRVQGKGAFVGHKWFDEHERKGGFRQSVLASGATASVRIPVRRLNCIDGEPVSIEMTLIPCLLFPGIEGVDISVFSLFETYDMLGRKPDQSVEKLDIEALGARDASLLNLEPGDLALVLEGLTYDSSGQAIEHAKSFTRGDAGGYTYNY